MLVKRRKWYGAGLTDLMLTATVGVERKLDILRNFVVGSTKLYVLKIVKDIEKYYILMETTVPPRKHP